MTSSSPLPLLAAAMAVALFLSCGGAGVPIPGLPPSSPNTPPLGPPPPGDPDQPIFDPGDTEGSAAGFSMNLDAGAGSAPGVSSLGFVNYQTTPRLLTMLTDAGASGALMRLPLRLNAPNPDWLQDVGAAHAAGMRIWMGVAGTPLGLSDINDTVSDNGLPPYARRPPTDLGAWADLVVARVQSIQSTYGFLPDYVEIWNEPDRPEFFSGSLDDYLAIYSTTATRLRAAFPTLKVGGMGLADSSSTMGGSESAILALIDRANNDGLPLDFVSWHHYTIANGLLASDAVNQFRDALAAADFPTAEVFVSEWNIYPSPVIHGPEFDRSKAAANYAGFITTARQLGLDGNLFFMLQDNAGAAGSLDLTGLGMGALTAHGIKKPVFRLMEFMQPMSNEGQIQVLRPSGELATNVYATRSGSRVRCVVSNSVVDGAWVWTHRLRDMGFTPGTMWPLFKAAAWEAGNNHPSHSLMMAHGLTSAEADAIEGITPELEQAWVDATTPRVVEIQLNTVDIPSVANIHLFDDNHNNPAAEQASLQPQIELSEDAAKLTSYQAAANYLSANGTAATVNDLMGASDVAAWALAEGASAALADAAEDLFFETLEDARFQDQSLLNSLPQTTVQSIGAAAAGISLVDHVLRISLAPDAVVVFDVLL